ncbi:unnamed protein product [Gongylonema pulchrum]|uniref:ApoC-IB n=1 Tax=Gongylonema pulchrum TaxID=637853 RepID=A0A183CVM6_9BILA|nr:unnamed protein product [Gongylonema pulchrum]
MKGALITWLLVQIFLVLGDQFPKPTFLDHLPKTAKEEVENILWSNRNKSDSQVEAELEKWANTQGGAIKVAFYCSSIFFCEN